MAEQNTTPKKVTVITVVINRIESIRETIEDTLSQTYSNLEYIVVDGGSSDGTLDVIKNYSDKIIWKSEPDNGIYDAMMKGVRMATGEWILFRNVGDFFYNHYSIENIFSEYNDNGEDLIMGGVRNFTNDYYKDELPQYPQQHYFDCMPAWHPATFIRRSTQLRYPFPSQYKQSADYWFFISVLKEGGTYFKTKHIVSIFDMRHGASTDNYDITLSENLNIFVSFDAPKEKIKLLEKKLSHQMIKMKRRKWLYWDWHYKIMRWYYCYYKDKEWHRYSSLSQLFGS